jgi:hypothetical protein
MSVVVSLGPNVTSRGSNPPSRPSEPVGAACVYGDSTPFPYEGTFIETIRHAIECGVSLMGAQHTIMRSGARANEVERARQIERARLETMGTALKRNLLADMTGASERVQRTGARVIESARLTVEAEIAALEAVAHEELNIARSDKERARASALRAVETFLLHHDIPGSQVGLRIVANENGYASQALVGTPFGVEAVFDLLVPVAHEWGRVRRVGDLTTGVEVHVPLPSGLFIKRVEVQSVKLDRLYLSTLHLTAERSVITLRRGPRSGTGFKVIYDGSQHAPPRVILSKIEEDGTESPEPALELTGGDAMHVLRLWQRVLDSTRDLTMRRNAMVSAHVNGRAILDVDEPQVVCERLVRALAPIVREVARRSGASGELVLRRDVRAGRRDEVYITKAELHEKVLTLPPALRGVFDPFELDSPRSPRAPAPSLPAYEEIDEADVEALEPSKVVPLLTA